MCLLISSYIQIAMAAADTGLKEGCVFSLIHLITDFGSGMQLRAEKYSITCMNQCNIGFCLTVKCANQDKCVHVSSNEVNNGN